MFDSIFLIHPPISTPHCSLVCYQVKFLVLTLECPLGSPAAVFMRGVTSLIQLMCESILKPSLLTLITVFSRLPMTSAVHFFFSFTDQTKHGCLEIIPRQAKQKHQMVPEHYQCYHLKHQLDWSFISDHDFCCIVPQNLKLCKELLQEKKNPWLNCERAVCWQNVLNEKLSRRA